MTDYPTGRSQCIRVASEPVIENGLRPVNERQASSLSAPDHLGTSCIEELSRFDFAAAHGYQPHAVVWGEGASGQLCRLLESLFVGCSQRQLAREDMHLASVTKGCRQIAERSGLADQLKMPF